MDATMPGPKRSENYGWDLPPGTTDADIDEHYAEDGEDDDDACYREDRLLEDLEGTDWFDEE